AGPVLRHRHGPVLRARRRRRLPQQRGLHDGAILRGRRRSGGVPRRHADLPAVIAARVWLPALVLAIGCGGSVAGTGGAGGQSATTTSSSTTSASSSSGGGAAPLGQCASDADCGGAPCVLLTPDGYGVCIVHVDPVTECGPLMGCCNSDLCPGESQ